MNATTDKPVLLIIDDDSRILRAMRLVLRSDYEVLLAASLSEARALLASGVVEVVLCDQRMPDGLGSDFLAQLAHDQPHLTRLLHSGSPPDNVEELIARGTIAGLVMKPASIAELRQGIEKIRKRTSEGLSAQ